MCANRGGSWGCKGISPSLYSRYIGGETDACAQVTEAVVEPAFQECPRAYLIKPFSSQKSFPGLAACRGPISAVVYYRVTTLGRTLPKHWNYWLHLEYNGSLADLVCYTCADAPRYSCRITCHSRRKSARRTPRRLMQQNEAFAVTWWRESSWVRWKAPT